MVSVSVAKYHDAEHAKYDLYANYDFYAKYNLY